MPDIEVANLIGSKMSGIGRESGLATADNFTERKTVLAAIRPIAQTIVSRMATDAELRDCEGWELWSSGDASHFEHFYDQDTQFVTLIGEAVILAEGHDSVIVKAGQCVTIPRGVDGHWKISATVVNRYRYL